MQTPPLLTDRNALTRNRIRAAAAPVEFLHTLAADEIKDRLSLVNKTFNAPAVVTGHDGFWSKVLPGFFIAGDDETLDLEPRKHDLVVHAMAMHWANDPVGQMVQCLRALQPDGLFMAVLLGGQTLNELRTALARAEVEVAGGLSPRVAPMAEIRDLGALLQRAGFSLPVADSVRIRTSYASPFHLMRELRAMGESNALASRRKIPPQPTLFRRASEIYQDMHADADGRIAATFDLIFLLGWAPDPSQPKPLRPGSAQSRLAQALGVAEQPLKD